MEKKRINDFWRFEKEVWQKESTIKVLLIVENSKAKYLKVF